MHKVISLKCSLDILDKLFWYDEAEGGLYRKKSVRKTGRSKRSKLGDKVAVCDPSGYKRLLLDGTYYKEHRVIWAMQNDGDWPEVVHHKNGNPSDNRIENLQGMTNSEHGIIHGAENGKCNTERATKRKTDKFNKWLSDFNKGDQDLVSNFNQQYEKEYYAY